jgi:sec-independent protein translocase protein TatA
VQSQRHEYLTPFKDNWPRCYNQPTVAGSGGLKESAMFSLIGPLGLPEMLIILAIVILIFGANRLPELGKGIGAGIKNFKSSMKEGTDQK